MTFHKSITCVLAGLWLLHEATIFGVLLHNGETWVYFPLSHVFMWIAERLHCPYIFWGALFVVFSFGGLLLLVMGVVTLFQSLFPAPKISTSKELREPATNDGEA